MYSLLLLPLLLGFSGKTFVDSKTHKIDALAVSLRNYIFSGTDNNGSINREYPNVIIHKEDSIISYGGNSPEDKAKKKAKKEKAKFLFKKRQAEKKAAEGLPLTKEEKKIFIFDSFLDDVRKKEI